MRRYIVFSYASTSFLRMLKPSATKRYLIWTLLLQPHFLSKFSFLHIERGVLPPEFLPCCQKVKTPLCLHCHLFNAGTTCPLVKSSQVFRLRKKAAKERPCRACFRWHHLLLLLSERAAPC